MNETERRFLELLLRETPESVSQLIEKLDRWLQMHRPDYYGRLQPGASASDIAHLEQEFAIQLPLSFRMLYQWRDGQRPDCHASLQQNRMLMSLEEVADTKRMLDGMIGHDFEDPNWWRKEWVPFLSNGGGDHLCLDLSSADGEIPPRVIAYWHDSENRSLEHPSLKVWLNRLVCSMEDGTYQVV